MLDCNNCGKCCYHDLGGGQLVKCPYLINFPSGQTRCRIYATRLKKKFKIQGKYFRCVMYNSLPFEIKDCSMNEHKKPIKIYQISKNKKSGNIIKGVERSSL